MVQAIMKGIRWRRRVGPTAHDISPLPRSGLVAILGLMLCLPGCSTRSKQSAAKQESAEDLRARLEQEERIRLQVRERLEREEAREREAPASEGQERAAAGRGRPTVDSAVISPPLQPGADPRTGILWIKIPGGAFNRGSETGERHERPVQRVRIKTFWMAKSEVSIAQYRRCVTAGACRPPKRAATGLGTYECNWSLRGRERHPVNCVDWLQASEYALWAGGRLPSESEWEYAARGGGKQQAFPWGNDPANCFRAVMSVRRNGRGGGCERSSDWPVCSKPGGHTAHGLCDMAGNVWEWVADAYHRSYDGAPLDGSAWGGPGAQHRVRRGGSRNLSSRFLRAAHRARARAGERSVFTGFRIAKLVER